MKKVLWSVAVCLCVVLAGCNGSGDATSTAASGQLKVVTTTGMIADIVSNIGGEHVQVQSLMSAGVDPHLYKATPGDIRKLNEADLVFYNGLHLEGKMADVLEKLGKRKPSIAVAENVPKETLLNIEETPEFPDPHLWFDVQKWMIAAEAVRDELIKNDEANRESFVKNAKEYLQRLSDLDEYVKEQIATIPSEQRVLVTAHDAFGYFGNAYGIEVRGLQGISTATEASLQDVQRIVNMLVKRKIKAVFVESSVPRRTVEAVVQGARARGHEVKIGGELFSDAMGKAGTPEGTYEGMVRHNVDTIAKALR